MFIQYKNIERISRLKKKIASFKLIEVKMRIKQKKNELLTIY